jgi:thiamine biosynthesis lipoprotein
MQLSAMKYVSTPATSPGSNMQVISPGWRVMPCCAEAPVVVSAATAAVVERALHWAEHTAGTFDPCLGEVCQLWDVEHRQAPPAQGEVRHFAGEGLFRQVDLDRRGGERVVYFHSRDVALDLGGIGKGWAVDRAVDALRAHGIRDAVVNAGGDLYAMGNSERGDPWEIGVQSPTDPHALAATLRLSDAAVATSGDYVHSVSVRAATCMDADAGATAVFGCDPLHAQSLLAGAASGARLVHSI